MEKFLFLVVALALVSLVLKIEGRSLPGVRVDEGVRGSRVLRGGEKLARVRRHGGLKPKGLIASTIPRDGNELAEALENSEAHPKVLCEIPDAKPGTKIFCPEAKMHLEWFPVGKDAKINVYQNMEVVESSGTT